MLSHLADPVHCPLLRQPHHLHTPMQHLTLMGHRDRLSCPVHSFVGGREVEFRFSYWGYQLRFELAEMDSSKEIAR